MQYSWQELLSNLYLLSNLDLMDFMVSALDSVLVSFWLTKEYVVVTPLNSSLRFSTPTNVCERGSSESSRRMHTLQNLWMDFKTLVLHQNKLCFNSAFPRTAWNLFVYVWLSEKRQRKSFQQVSVPQGGAPKFGNTMLSLVVSQDYCLFQIMVP